MVLAATANTQNLTGEHDLFDEYIFNEARWSPSPAHVQQALIKRVRSLSIED